MGLLKTPISVGGGKRVPKSCNATGYSSIDAESRNYI